MVCIFLYLKIQKSESKMNRALLRSKLILTAVRFKSVPPKTDALMKFDTWGARKTFVKEVPLERVENKVLWGEQKVVKWSRRKQEMIVVTEKQSEIVSYKIYIKYLDIFIFRKKKLTSFAEESAELSIHSRKKTSSIVIFAISCAAIRIFTTWRIYRTIWSYSKSIFKSLVQLVLLLMFS